MNQFSCLRFAVRVVGKPSRECQQQSLTERSSDEFCSFDPLGHIKPG